VASRLLEFKRKLRLKKAGAAETLFDDITGDGDVITVSDLRESLGTLGLRLGEERMRLVADNVSMEQRGRISKDEFVAWVTGRNVSRSRMSGVVIKILLGLGQVISKQPEVLKTDYPGLMWDSEWLKVLSFDFAWVFPICQVSYASRFVLNTIIFPVSLVGLVAATWATNRQQRPAKAATKNTDGGDDPSKDDDDYDELRASRNSDYYFAFFLSYPTMTQTFIKHFSCRSLSAKLSVLEADYEAQCYPDELASQWWILAAVSALGLVVVSLGVPIIMFLAMRRDMGTRMRGVVLGKVPLAVAHRNHGRKFIYMSGEFRPQAGIYAEPVDLVRKLVLTGLITLIPSGTVIQAFSQVLFSLTFMGFHMRLWPYPDTASNVLKLAALST